MWRPSVGSLSFAWRLHFDGSEGSFGRARGVGSTFYFVLLPVLLYAGDLVVRLAHRDQNARVVGVKVRHKTYGGAAVLWACHDRPCGSPPVITGGSRSVNLPGFSSMLQSSKRGTPIPLACVQNKDEGRCPSAHWLFCGRCEDDGRQVYPGNVVELQIESPAVCARCAQAVPDRACPRPVSLRLCPCRLIARARCQPELIPPKPTLQSASFGQRRNSRQVSTVFGIRIVCETDGDVARLRRRRGLGAFVYISLPEVLFRIRTWW